MHYFAAVLLKDKENVEEQVRDAMEPYNEETSDEGWWDWWVIGGRYTGRWSEYDPAKDPANWESCFICQGTGMRSDDLGVAHRRENPEYTCNGCGMGDDAELPVGMRVKRPSSWAPFPGDIAPAKWLPGLAIPYTLVAPDRVMHREVWDGKNLNATPDWEATYVEAVQQYPDMFAVIVDYHD